MKSTINPPKRVVDKITLELTPDEFAIIVAGLTMATPSVVTDACKDYDYLPTAGPKGVALYDVYDALTDIAKEVFE